MIEEVDEVRAWRVDGVDRAIWMSGRTTGYSVEPAGECVIGVATAVGYRLRRGRLHHDVRAGDLVVLDGNEAHRGSPLVNRPWSARLLALELPDVDEDPSSTRTVTTPVRRDTTLARRFVAMHRASSDGTASFEVESRLTALLGDLFEAPATGRRDDATVAVAATYLRDNVDVAVSLDELARVAGVSKFHLVRQFRAVLGVPPHSYQIGLRVLLARRLLERGTAISEVAARIGFTDQSHLHRHFRARLGITPGRYATAFEQPGEPPPEVAATRLPRPP
jgi:AraC-like DNA-binding protein